MHIKVFSHLNVLILLILFASCEEKNKESTENKNYIIIHYPDGEVKGKFKYRIEKGDTVAQGDAFGFYPDGSIMFKTQMVDGMASGPYYAYYEDGGIEYSGIIKENKIIGEKVTYFESGELKAYTLHDQTGNLRFRMNYDKEGDIERIQGNPIGQLVYNKNNNQLLINDTINLKFLIANPPHSKKKFSIWKTTGNQGADTSRSAVKPIFVQDSIANVKMSFNEKGKHFIYAELLLYDLNGNLLKKGDFEAEITTVDPLNPKESKL